MADKHMTQTYWLVFKRRGEKNHFGMETFTSQYSHKIRSAYKQENRRL